MRGKTRGLLEDIAILGLCGWCLYGGYNLFFGSEDRLVSADKSTQKVITTKQVVVTNTQKQQDNNNTITSKTSKNNSSLDKNPNTSKYAKQHNKTNTKQANKQISKPISKPKQQITKTTQEKQTEKKKNVNLRSLYIFLANTKQKVYNSIDWSKANKDIQDNFLKIRVTILKDGNYEQLIFVDGDKELFEANKQNITKIFPLIIKDDIKDDFPRYFRMNFDISYDK